MSDPASTTDQCVSVPGRILQRLIDMADSYWQDIDTGLDDGTYEKAENPTHAADESVIAMATQLVNGSVVIAAPLTAPLAAKVVVVLKDGEVAQVLSDKPGASVAVIEYGPQSEENLVLIPNGKGGFAKGWASVCEADLKPDRAAELYAVAESASLKGVVKDGQYSGQVVTVAAGIVTQKVDRQGNTVKHLADSLSQTLKVGAVVDIRYTHGVGVVTGRQAVNEQGR